MHAASTYNCGEPLHLPMSSSGANETPATPNATERPPVDSRFFLAPVGGAGWLAGIWLADRLPAPLLSWLAAGLALVIIAALLWRRGRVGLAVAFLAAVALGGARLAVTQPPLSAADIAYYNGAGISLCAVKSQSSR